MECRHCAIADGRCLDCGALVNGAETAQDAAEHLDGQKPTAAAETPTEGQETAKKAARKRKA